MLNDVRIGKKLGIGFGLATALLVMVSAVATSGLIQVSGGFDDYRKNAREAILLGQIEAKIYAARLAFRTYLHNDDPALIGTFKERFGKAEELLAEADKSIDQPQERAKLDEIRASAGAYAQGVNNIKALTEARADMIKGLAETAEVISANLAVIRANAERAGNAAVVAVVGVLNERLLLSRLNVAYFIGSNDQAYIDKVPVFLGGDVGERVAALKNAFPEEDIRSRLDQVRKDIEQYVAGAASVKTAVLALNALVDNVPNKMGRSDRRGGRGGPDPVQGRARRARDQGQVRQPDDHLHRASARPCSG